MTRPLMQHGVGQLEEMFQQGKSDRSVLLRLQEELHHRQVPRAVTLLTQVQRTLRALITTEPSTPAPTLVAAAIHAPTRSESPVPQPDLWTTHQVPAVSPNGLSLEPGDSPTLPLAEAYKVLRTTPGASWESIELTRRTLVQRSSPAKTRAKSSAERAALLIEARRVNQAYAVLSADRLVRN